LATRGFTVGGTAETPFNDNQSFIISTGDDPQILFAVPADIRGPAKLTISLKVTPATQQALEIFSARIKGLTASLQQQISAVETARDSLASQLTDAAAQAREAVAQRDATQRSLSQTEQSLSQTEQLLAAAGKTLYGMQHSSSWKVTAPLRKMMAVLRPKPRTVP
jgi:septal ring factor EnvC (AmiA/AmiB activator)